MIVKVQLSLWSSMDSSFKRDRQVLIYNQDKSICYQEMLSRFGGLEAAMGDRLRAFFEVDVVKHRDPRCQHDTHYPECECADELIFGKIVADEEW